MAKNQVFLDENVFLDLDRIAFYKHGFIVYLSPTQFLILKCLVGSLNRPITGEEIIQFAWGEDNNISSNELYVYINRIRKKIEDNYRKPKYLLLVRGYGYLLHSKLHETNSDSYKQAVRVP
jgi:DNA-binding response OmpR family regulator